MPPQSRGRFAPLIVTGLAAVVYVATLSRHYTGDSIEYALAIELGNRAHLLDPYHPLLHPLGLAFFRLWQAFGWTGQSLLPLQVLNALAGAICVGLVTDIARRITRSAPLGLVTGIGFAVSGGMWMLSVEAEFVTVPLAAALFVLWLLFAASPGQAQATAYPILLALASALAFWTFATGALLFLVVVTALLLDRRLETAVRRRQVLIFTGVLLVIVVPPSLLFLARWSQGDWQRVADYFLSRGTYSHFALGDLPRGAYGFLRSLFLFPRLSLIGTTTQFLAQASTTGRILFGVYYALALVAVCTPLLLAVRYRRRLTQAYRRVLAVLAVWSTGYGVFAILWVPGDVSFWLPLLAAWWLLLAVTLSTVADSWQPRQGLLLLGGLTAAVTALAVGNAAFEILPRRDLSTNLPYHVAAGVVDLTADRHLFLSRPDDITGLYLAYFGGRQVFYATPATLATLQSYLPQDAGEGLRLYAADADAKNTGWWQTLAGGQWQVLLPSGQPEPGLLVELVPG